MSEETATLFRLIPCSDQVSYSVQVFQFRSLVTGVSSWKLGERMENPSTADAPDSIPPSDSLSFHRRIGDACA